MSVKALPLQGENLKLVGWEGKPALVDTPDRLLDSVKSERVPILSNSTKY